MQKLCDTDKLLEILNQIVKSFGYGEIISIKLSDGISSDYTLIIGRQ